ncbi:N-terminal methylation site-containing protein [Microbulbifer donghaiensis]|uniref:Type II secretion system protein H n=1 Tax=Microbulbifer donghaiensis TaxID=494016 RepID=A0A1M5HEH6_9GAMM|nr:GspH/FimT family pseudopilin [Microbulbifer donghaiensis]SHG14232.1 N-terminal methylation site-containing protein [Microbulbifer donghaiensis]
MRPHNINKAVDPGFTLLEVMITIVIASILLTLGVPSLRNLFDALELKGASEQVYSHLQRARSEAISRKLEVGVNFSADGSSTWSYGLSDTNTGTCDTAETDASQNDACTLVVDDGDGTVHGIDGAVDTADKVLMRFTDADHDDIDMTLSEFTNANRIVFEPIRGTAMENSGNVSTGQILLQSNGGRQLLIKVGLLGQVRICSPDGSVNGYRDGAPSDDGDC